MSFLKKRFLKLFLGNEIQCVILYQDKLRDMNEASKLCAEKLDIPIEPNSMEDFQNYFEFLEEMKWKGEYLWLGYFGHRDYYNKKYFANPASTLVLDYNLPLWKKGNFNFCRFQCQFQCVFIY